MTCTAHASFLSLYILLQRIATLEKQARESVHRVTTLEVELAHSRERDDELTKSASKLQHELNRAAEDLSEARSERAEADRTKDERTRDLETRIESLSKTISELRERCRSDAERRNDVERLTAEVSARNRELEESAKDLERERELVRKSGETLETCRADHQERARCLRTDHEKAMDDARKRAQEQIGFYRTRAEGAERRELVANERRKVAEVDLAKQITSAEVALTEHKHRIHDELDGLHGMRMEELRESVDVLNAQRDSLKEELATWKESVKHLSEAREKENEEMQSIIKRLEEEKKRAIVVDLRSERELVGKLKTDAASLAADNVTLRTKVEQLELEIGNAKIVNAETTTKLRSRLAEEEKGRARDASEHRTRLNECHTRMLDLRQTVDRNNARYAQELHDLENGIISALQVIFSKRRRNSVGNDVQET